MKRYIALCMFMLSGIVVYFVMSSIPMSASFDDWQEELGDFSDYEIVHSASLSRRQQVKVLKLTEASGERWMILVGQNRLTHWKLIDSVDLGVYSIDSPGNQIEKPFLSAGYLASGELPPENCTHIDIKEDSYSLWYRLHEPGNHLGN